MLSAFGSDGADGEDVDGDGTVNVNDLLQLLSAFGSDDCAAGGGGGEPCAQGEDCGGQERTECGTACPSICGEAPAAFCVRMCVIGFQCPSNLFWDPGTNGAGSCVAEADARIDAAVAACATPAVLKLRRANGKHKHRRWAHLEREGDDVILVWAQHEDGSEQWQWKTFGSVPPKRRTVTGVREDRLGRASGLGLAIETAEGDDVLFVADSLKTKRV